MSYVPVRLSSLRRNDELPFDIFISVAGKHIHYVRRGEVFDGERLIRLKKKKVKKMFIRSADEKLYQQYVFRNLEEAFGKSSKKPLELRASMVQGFCQASVEEVLENPGSEMAYMGAKATAEKYIEFLLHQEGGAESILSIENIDKDLAHHGVSVATLSVAMAQKLGITEKGNLHTIIMGAYLHDIGHSSVETFFNLHKDRRTSTQEEAYKTHVKRGAEFARDKKHFDRAVINIILRHEELEDGSGYPEGLKDRKIDRFSKIVCICNVWDRMVSFEGLSKDSAIKKFSIEKIGKHPLDHIEALKEIMQESF